MALGKGKAVKEVLEVSGNIADNLTTTRDEENESINERWEADQTSDNWWSKSVRPLIILFLTLTFVVLAYLDSSLSGFEVKDTYAKIFEWLLTTVYIAYFGSRGVEKTMKIKNRQKNRDRKITRRANKSH